MSETVAPEAGIVPENDESKDVLPENVGTKPISSTANLAGWKTTRNRHCKSRTPGTANLAPLALQMPQGCYIRIKPSMKTLHVNHTPLSLRESSPQAGSAPPEGWRKRFDWGLRGRGRDKPSRVRPLQAVADHRGTDQKRP